MDELPVLQVATQAELDALLPSVLDRAFLHAMQGDMIDCLYTLVRQEFPDTQLYATSFEFGTLGATVRSLRAMVLENQMHWFGATTQEVQERIERDFAELFFPSEKRWRAKAVADAHQALRGILGAEGFLS